MKKLGMVLLSLGLVAALCQPGAAAIEMKWSGTYIITGSYEHNRYLEGDAHSQSYYAQRLRFQPEFKIAEGLKVRTRIDTMQRVWGQNGIGSEKLDSNWDNYRNKAGEQNIQFRRAWVTFDVPFGTFDAGYMADGIFGLGSFGNLDSEGPVISFRTKIDTPYGQFVPLIGCEKIVEGALGNNIQGDSLTGSDFDKYFAFLTYYANSGELGLGWVWYKNDSLKSGKAPNLIEGGTYPFGAKMDLHWIESHGRYTYGPLLAEYEFIYEFGKLWNYQDGGNAVAGDDIDSEAFEWFINLKYTHGPAYVGFQYGYSSGTDWSDLKNDHDNSGFTVVGYGIWQPTLILFNNWFDRFAGPNGGRDRNPAFANYTYNNTFVNGSSFANASLYQLYGGYSPIPKLGLKASIAFVQADETWKHQDDYIGTELDLSASYKIYDNLEYMVGFGYLWAGDYWEGPFYPDPTKQKKDDDYMLVNQLTLSF